MTKVTKHRRTWYTLEHEGQEFEVQFEPTGDPIIKKLDDGRTVIGYLSQDPDPLNPRKEYDNLGTMVCWHRRYDLGDKHRHENPDALWRELLGDDEYEKLDQESDAEMTKWMEAHPGVSYSSNEYGRKSTEVARAMRKTVRERVDAKGYIVLPLFLLDHSGITMSTGSFSHVDPGGWDSGQVGYIYLTPEAIKENWSAESLDSLVDYHDGKPAKSARERAMDLLNAEVEEYDHYLTGDCYGVCVETFDQEGKQVEEDACWGHFGCEWAEQALNDQFQSTIKHLTEKSENL